ncbi:MAG TPA: hypothetical protein VF653_16590 [Methylomirabilota bacterium]
MSRAYASPVGNPVRARLELRRLIAATAGRFFSVLFVKRGTNEPRRMLARLKRVTGDVRAVDTWNAQVTVWDVQKRDWRVVPLERVVELRCGATRWLTDV